MDKFKNIKSIGEVEKVLEEFQKAYDRKDLNSLDCFVEKMFTKKNGFAAVGSGMKQWAFEVEGAKKIVESHWKEENYFKNMNFKFDTAKVYATEEVALVVTLGEMQDEISEEKRLGEAVEKIKAIAEMNKTKENGLRLARAVAEAIRDTNKGEKYVWPFRFTGVLIKENNEWKFHQMQFSLDSTTFWQYRNTDENFDPYYVDMPESERNEDTEAVRKLLGVFQEGYDRRDVDYVDEYMKKVFVMEEEQVVIGTDADELCLGIDAIRGIIESDWKYWGDFSMNVEGAIINVIGDVAYFSTKAMIRRTSPAETMIGWCFGGIDYNLGNKDASLKENLLTILCDAVELTQEAERGERFIAPMRFSGVMIKKDGEWRIHHLQYSDYIDGMPGARK